MKEEFFKIDVVTYSGYKGAERPLAFIWKGRRIECKEIIDRWYGEGHEYFKVKGNDDIAYLMRYDRSRDVWELTQIQKEGV